MIHRTIGMAVLKDKHRQPVVKAVKTDVIQKLLAVGERADLHSDFCRSD